MTRLFAVEMVDGEAPGTVDSWFPEPEGEITIEPNVLTSFGIDKSDDPFPEDDSY